MIIQSIGGILTEKAEIDFLNYLDKNNKCIVSSDYFCLYIYIIEWLDTKNINVENTYDKTTKLFRYFVIVEDLRCFMGKSTNRQEALKDLLIKINYYYNEISYFETYIK